MMATVFFTRSVYIVKRLYSIHAYLLLDIGSVYCVRYVFYSFIARPGCSVETIISSAGRWPGKKNK